MARVASAPSPIRSDIAWSAPTTVRGLALRIEILAHFTLANLSFPAAHRPSRTSEWSRVYDAVLIIIVEHGLSASTVCPRARPDRERSRRG